MRKELHPKIKELQLRSTPISMSGSYVDKDGQLRTIDFKVSASEDNRTIKGYLCVWGVVDTFGTIFVRGCFAKSIQERGPASASKQKIAHLWMHDPCNPTGMFTTLKEDDYGLYFEATLDAIDIGDRELTQVRSGTLNQFSVGFDYVWDKMEYDEKQDAVVIMECILMEGSVVTFGSNAETYAMRSVTELENDKAVLIEETDFALKGLPFQKQIELRQLINKHISLHTVKPKAERANKPTLDLSIPEPVESVYEVGGYKLNLNEF